MVNIKSIKKYQLLFVMVALMATFSLGIWARAYGEQSGSSPESGATSYIRSLYDSLQTAGFGNDAASPDWGTTWNRIKTAAQWAPNGSVTAADVASGKTFYNSSRTQQTGTLLVAGSSCPTQQYTDNYGAPVTQSTNCSNSSDWVVVSDGVTGNDKKDTRSGLIWSYALFNAGGSLEFRLSNNTRWSWDASNSANVAVGNKTAITLCSSTGNGWRLPTQKELMQAYIDGAYFNLTQTETNMGYYGSGYWSVTKYSDTSAWKVGLNNGYQDPSAMTNNTLVRCVR